MPFEFEIGPENAGERLDVALARAVPGLSRRAARRHIDDGSVFVDGARERRMSRALSRGARVSLRATERRDVPDVVVLAHRGGLVFVDKPFMVPTEATETSARGALAPALADHLAEGGARPRFLAAAHRLDVETTGVVTFALTRDAAERMRARFEAGTVARTYLAVAHGSHAADHFVSDAPLDVDSGPMVVVDPAHGRSARTLGRVLARADDAVLLALTIVTGRRHQIRVHLAHAGLPLVGDRRYGRSAVDGAFGLHALSLAFSDDGEPIDVTAPPSSSFLRALAHAHIDVDFATLPARARAALQDLDEGRTP